MNRSQVLKSITNRLPVQMPDSSELYYPMEYISIVKDSGEMESRVGCVSEKNLYIDLPLEQLMPATKDLSRYKIGKLPEWTGRMTSEAMLKAMKDKTPVMSGGFTYDRIMKLSIGKGTMTRDLTYAVTLEDKAHRSLVKTRLDAVEPIETEET